MLDIPFSCNWNNKLDCKALTTIRLYSSTKHIPGAPVRLMLKGVNKGTGKIIEVKTFMLDNLNEYMSFLDMGYPAKEGIKIIKTMYAKIDFTTKKLAFILIVKD